MRIRLVIGSLIAFVAAAPSLGETPLGTGFTYHGQLKQDGAPFEGTADFQFTLWDAAGGGNPPVGGTQVGGAQAINALNVTAGLFTVALNAGGEFGASAFIGEQRWLEISVNGTRLSPRQELTAVPYALHSAGPWVTNDHDISYVSGAVGVGTAAPQAKLHVGGVAGVDGIMFPDGSVQTSAAGLGGGDGFWSPSGSNIFSNNGGNVGIGTTTPHHRLRISGGPPWTSNGWTGSLELDNRSALGWRANDSLTGFGIGRTNGGLFFFRTPSDPGTALYGAFYDMVINDSGNIGIGTTAPQSKVEIAATGDGAELLRLSTERPWVFRQVRTGSSTGLQLLSTSGSKKFEITANDGNNVATFLAESGTSRVGIGTTEPASKLDVVVATAPPGANATAISGVTSTVGATAISGYSSAATCDFFGFCGIGVQGASNAGIGVYGRSDRATGFDVYAGGVGIDYGSSSSIRWKSNVRNIDQPREKLARLRGVYFDWDGAHGGHHDLGMIAEEVGAVLPEIVGYEENGIDANGMDYSKLTPLLVEAAKDQQRQIDALRQENTELRKRLEALEARRR
jgi:hypothetical protein